ncbi:MAG: hypothetical protein CM1200mP1_02770 [Candidatus Neomarinimicrobiota bacterium]|nr:MAG: hypothetical protein CM1200mP1_02770 [Candidatus Neomarinimicrobiota bacterium]
MFLILGKIFFLNINNLNTRLKIAMCGKNTELPDAYKSVLESFIHAGVENDARVNVHWVATEDIKSDKDAGKDFWQNGWNSTPSWFWF